MLGIMAYAMGICVIRRYQLLFKLQVGKTLGCCILENDSRFAGEFFIV